MPAIASAAQGVIGGVQGILGMIQANKAQKRLENMVNNYKPNESILDFYNKSLNRYNANPYNSALYRNATQAAQRNLTTGLSAAQDRRGGLSAISPLIQNTNDANLKSIGAAENDQSRNLAQLGNATQLKSQEDFKPFQMKYNLLSAKASGGNQIMNAGLSNLYGGLSGQSDYNTASKMYGGGGGRNRIGGAGGSAYGSFPIGTLIAP